MGNPTVFQKGTVPFSSDPASPGGGGIGTVPRTKTCAVPRPPFLRDSHRLWTPCLRFSPGAESPAAEPETPAASERGRLREFLAAQERRFTRVESLLREEVERLDCQLSGSDEALAELRQQREELAAAGAGDRRAPGRAGRRGIAIAAAACRRAGVREGDVRRRRRFLGRSSWEAEKRRILAALESEADGEDAVEVGARLKLEEIIDTTDRLVADKDREVAELQSLLASQSGNLGAVAVGAAAVGQLIDQDTVVQQQRETLKRLQEQWMEKLREAEIDISRERAQLARQSVELDEKRRAWRCSIPAAKGRRARRVAAAGWRGLG